MDWISKALQESTIREKCAVGDYKTTISQLSSLRELIDVNGEIIPLEWVIDIADENNGWFYGTAYNYNNATNMLHVMVPDKENPVFDGEIPLDSKVVHLIECVDRKSLALFNKIIRDSMVKVNWELEWREDGNWIFSTALFYFPMSSQLLVKDKEFQETKGMVLLTADADVRLCNCIDQVGIVAYENLLDEGRVLKGTRTMPKKNLATRQSKSLISRALTEETIQEKCVYSSYRTTIEQLELFKELVEELQPPGNDVVPLEWAVEVSLETNGWCQGTAYHYNNETDMLHVMIPYQRNAEFPLSSRVVHLIECVDRKSLALFNKIIRDSMVKVNWELEWREDGNWIFSTALFYFPMSSQLLVKDKEFQETKWMVLLTADADVRLCNCIDQRGIVAYENLLDERRVGLNPLRGRGEGGNLSENLSDSIGTSTPGADPSKAAATVLAEAQDVMIEDFKQNAPERHPTSNMAPLVFSEDILPPLPPPPPSTQTKHQIPPPQVEPTCIICLDQPRTHLIMPCFHFIACSDCIQNFAVGSECPVCRTRVMETKQVFTS